MFQSPSDSLGVPHANEPFLTHPHPENPPVMLTATPVAVLRRKFANLVVALSNRFPPILRDHRQDRRQPPKSFQPSLLFSRRETVAEEEPTTCPPYNLVPQRIHGEQVARTYSERSRQSPILHPTRRFFRYHGMEESCAFRLSSRELQLVEVIADIQHGDPERDAGTRLTWRDRKSVV